MYRIVYCTISLKQERTNDSKHFSVDLFLLRGEKPVKAWEEFSAFVLVMDGVQLLELLGYFELTKETVPKFAAIFLGCGHEITPHNYSPTVLQLQ